MGCQLSESEFAELENCQNLDNPFVLKNAVRAASCLNLDFCDYFDWFDLDVPCALYAIG